MQVQRTSSMPRTTGALAIVLAMTLLQGYLSWQFVMVAADRLRVLNFSIIQLVGGVGFVLSVATLVLTWVLISGSLHTGALILGGIGSFQDLLEELGYNFVILLAAAVIAVFLWQFEISPAVVVAGSRLDMTSGGATKAVAVMNAIQQSAYLLFGARAVRIVAKGYQLPTWKAAIAVIAPVLLITGLRYAYHM